MLNLFAKTGSGESKETETSQILINLQRKLQDLFSCALLLLPIRLRNVFHQPGLLIAFPKEFKGFFLKLK